MSAQPTSVSILVVDDDAMSREVLALLLEHEGHRVHCAASGDEALRLLGAGLPVPQVVLSDVQMPGTSGRALALRMREVCGKGMLLLAMSGSGSCEEEISSFDGFLLKPFQVSDLAPFLVSQQQGGTRPGVLEQLAAGADTATLAAGAAEDERAGVLDEKIYGQLAAAMPTQQLHQMYTMCLEDARERITSMRELQVRGDGVQFCRQAHALKGGCGMLGASELYRLAGQLEKAGMEPRLAGVNPLDELHAACDRLERILGSRAVASS